MNTDYFSDKLFQLLLVIPALVAALTVHEFAHAWMGNRLGDDTARRLGRLTLDPMAHLDPFGVLFFLLAWFSGFGLGWAKPVPFDPRNLSHPRRDAILIAIAGPISNLLQVPFWLLALWILRLVAQQSGWDFLGEPTAMPAIIRQVLEYGVLLNILLAAFNMIPLPPLDGHYVLEGLGPPYITNFFNQIRPWSFLILIILLQLPSNPVRQAIAPFLMLANRLIDLVLFGWRGIA